MPHFVLEYSHNIQEEIDFQDFFQRLHSLLVQNGPFRESDIKSRAICHRQYCVADGDDSNAFVHLTLSILSGRHPAILKKLGDKILTLLKDEFVRTLETMSCSVTLEIREMQRPWYFKATSGRLKP